LFSPWLLNISGLRGLQAAGATEGFQRKTSGLIFPGDHRLRVKLFRFAEHFRP